MGRRARQMTCVLSDSCPHDVVRIVIRNANARAISSLGELGCAAQVDVGRTELVVRTYVTLASYERIATALTTIAGINVLARCFNCSRSMEDISCASPTAPALRRPRAA